MKVEKLVEIIGSDFYSGVPDSQLKALCNYLMATYGIDPKHHVIAAGNRISASRLFELSTALETPVSFFFRGLPGNTPEETRSGRRVARVADPDVDDPLARNESLQVVNLYWRLANDDQRKMVMKMLKTLNGVNS